MAKDPSQRYASTLELARAARMALDARAAQPTVVSPDATKVRAAAAPDAPRRSRRRIGILVAAIVATVVAGAGIVAFAKLTDRQEVGDATPPGPLDGTFTAQFGPKTSLSGEPYTGTLVSEPYEGTWSIRSACEANTCVATATLSNTKQEKPSTFVFDEIDREWVTVTTRPGKCTNVDVDLWAILALRLNADGTLSGEYIEASADECVTKQVVTFARTGGVDSSVDVADPGTQSPRLVSPAQRLHGQYHNVRTYTQDGNSEDEAVVVLTRCLRSGDRCVSLVYSPGGGGQQVLVFAKGQWVRNRDGNVPCQLGGTAHVIVTVTFPLPTSPQDPISLLTGRGHVESTGSACTNSDFDEKFERTGD